MKAKNFFWILAKFMELLTPISAYVRQYNIAYSVVHVQFCVKRVHLPYYTEMSILRTAVMRSTQA